MLIIMIVMVSEVYYVSYLSLVLLSNNQSSYHRGSSAKVTCTSSYHIRSIQWINVSSNEVLVSTSADVLVLHIQNISSHHHRTTYTCQVDFLLPSGAPASDRNNFTIVTGIIIRSTPCIFLKILILVTVPGIVKDVVATSPDDSTLVLKWVMPDFFEQDILNYTVFVNPLTSVYDGQLSASRKTAVELHIQNTTLVVTGLSKPVFLIPGIIFTVIAKHQLLSAYLLLLFFFLPL